MKKSGEFVGVDEKFVPEDEKYVDESIIGNKEKSKKVLKGVGIGYLVFGAIVFVLVVAVFIYTFNSFFKTRSAVDDIINSATGMIGDIQNGFEEDNAGNSTVTDDVGGVIADVINQGEQSSQEITNEANVQMFNAQFEVFGGKRTSLLAGNIIDRVYANNNKGERIISLKFEGKEITDNNEIKTLSSKLTKDEYYISYEYDEAGYIKTAVIE